MLVVSENEGGSRKSSLDWALNILGDRWTLLVLYEISTGTCRFNDIQRHTGMSRDRLAVRLRRLEARSLVRRCRYCDHPPRYEYGLTPAGLSLMPTLDALGRWAARYSPPECRLEVPPPQ
jgi:DNA-binding HxlR family transcriptional regulator